VHVHFTTHHYIICTLYSTRLWLRLKNILERTVVTIVVLYRFCNIRAKRTGFQTLMVRRCVMANQRLRPVICHVPVTISKHLAKGKEHREETKVSLFHYYSTQSLAACRGASSAAVHSRVWRWRVEGRIHWGAKGGSTEGRGKVAEGVVGGLVFTRLYLWEPVLSLLKLE
jgi:hypothetical protein